MGKTGRNEPCPYGSGRKYKDCCLGKDVTESIHNPLWGFKEELQNTLGGRVFESIDEVNDFLLQFTDRKNSAPMLDFLGLSSDVMQRLLCQPLEQLENIDWSNISQTPKPLLTPHSHTYH